MRDPFPDTSLGFSYKTLSLSPHLIDGETEVSMGRAGHCQWRGVGTCPWPPPRDSLSTPAQTAARVGQPWAQGLLPPAGRSQGVGVPAGPPLLLISGAGSNPTCLLGHTQRGAHVYTCTRMHTHRSKGPHPGKSKHLLQGKQQARLPREKMWPNQTQAACGPHSRWHPRVTMTSQVWW